MHLPPLEDPFEDNECLNRCQKLVTWLVTEKITFDEFAYNVTLTIVSASNERMQQCTAMIPFSAVARYRDYLRSVLEPIDFKPCPMPFLVGPVSAEEIEQAKEQLRPKYIRLYHLLNENEKGT